MRTHAFDKLAQNTAITQHLIMATALDFKAMLAAEKAKALARKTQEQAKQQQDAVANGGAGGGAGAGASASAAAATTTTPAATSTSTVATFPKTAFAARSPIDLEKHRVGTLRSVFYIPDFVTVEEVGLHCHILAN